MVDESMMRVIEYNESDIEYDKCDFRTCDFRTCKERVIFEPR